MADRRTRRSKPARSAHGSQTTPKIDSGQAKPQGAAKPQGTVQARAELPAEGLVEIGYVAKVHGLLGEVRVVPHNPDTTLLSRGRNLILGPGPHTSAGQRALGFSSHKVFASRAVPGGYLIRFEHIGTRAFAEKLRGLAVWVDRSELDPPEEGAFYASDLAGCRVELVSGDVLGAVAKVIEYPSVCALVIPLDDGRVIEVPMVDDYIALVDSEAHLIKLHHIDEL